MGKGVLGMIMLHDMANKGLGSNLRMMFEYDGNAVYSTPTGLWPWAGASNITKVSLFLCVFGVAAVTSHH